MAKKKRSKRTYHLKRKIRTRLRSLFSWPAKPAFEMMMRLPASFIRIAAEFSGLCFWILSANLRGVALKNLRIVYKDSLSEKELKAIVKDSMMNISRTLFECPLIMKHHRKIVNDVTVEGEDYLKDALKNGNGVLGLGSHTGNFLLMLTALTMKGYPVSFVFKEPMDKGFSSHFWRLMKDLNLNPIPVKPRSVATKRSLKTLKDKEILWIAADQDVREGSLGVEFFGVKTSTAKGPAALAIWSGAKILPMTIRRLGWLKHKIIIHKPFCLETTGDREVDIYAGLKAINGVVEKIILDNPREWWWVHNRWKRAYKYI